MDLIDYKYNTKLQKKKCEKTIVTELEILLQYQFHHLRS